MSGAELPNESQVEPQSSAIPTASMGPEQAVAATMLDQEHAALRLKLTYQARLGSAAARITRLDESVVHVVGGRLAAQLHEDWRAGYIATHRTGDGPDDFEPRWKTIGDDFEWLEHARRNPDFRNAVRQNPNTNAYEVDIARLPLNLLPHNPWVIDNITAATQAVALVHFAIGTHRRLDAAFLEQASGEIHNMWTYRHPYVREPADSAAEEATRAIQRLPYQDPQFTEVERNKDREHIVLAAELYAAVGEEVRPVESTPKRREFSLGIVSARATQLGSFLMRRFVRAPSLAEQSAHQEIAPDILEITASVQTLADAWREVSVIMTDEGNVVKTYHPQPDPAANPRALKTARLEYEAPAFESVIGAQFEDYLTPYTTFFYTKVPGRQGGVATIHLGSEHRYGADSHISHANNEQAVAGAQALLVQAGAIGDQRVRQ